MSIRFAGWVLGLWAVALAGCSSSSSHGTGGVDGAVTGGAGGRGGDSADAAVTGGAGEGGTAVTGDAGANGGATAGSGEPGQQDGGTAGGPGGAPGGAGGSAQGGAGGAGVVVAFSLSLCPSTLSLPPGGAGMTTVNIDRGTFAEDIYLRAWGEPSGITLSLTYASDGSTATLAVAVADTVPPGTYIINVTATGGPPVGVYRLRPMTTTTLTLTVTAPVTTLLGAT